MPTLKSLGQNFLLFSLSTCLALVGAEVAFRWFLPQQLILLRPDIWEPAEELGWQQAARIDTVVNTGERDVRLVTDQHRHRVPSGRSAERPAPGARILALGDSFLVAIQVEYKQTFAALLEADLGKRIPGDVEVVNTGVGGWGPNQYLIKLRQLLARGERYDLVAVFLYLSNDVETRKVASYSPRVSAAEAPFLLAPSLTASVRNLLIHINNVLETRSHLFNFLKYQSRFLRMRAGLVPYGFPAVLLKSHAEMEGWGVTAAICRDIRDLAGTRGVPVRFFFLPSPLMVDPSLAEREARAFGFPSESLDPGQASRLLAKEFSDQGLSAVDLTPAFQTENPLGNFGTVDRHLSPRGHSTVAAVVAPHLLRVLSP